MRPATIGLIREFNTKNFRTTIEAEEDWDVDLSFDEDGSVRKDLESGKLINFCAKVEVVHKETGDSLATEYLGGCIYKSIEEFMDHKECGKQNREYEAKGEAGRCGSYFTDMIKTACENARNEIAKRAVVYSAIYVRQPAEVSK